MSHSVKRSDLSPMFQVPDIVRLWILRMLQVLGASDHFIRENGYANTRVASSLGLLADTEFTASKAFEALRRAFREAEAASANTTAPAVLRKNIERVAELIGLSDCDCRVLEFIVLLRAESILDDVADWLGAVHSAKVVPVLAAVLDRPAQDIDRSLAESGPLVRAGLVTLGRASGTVLGGKLQLLPGFSYRIFEENLDLLDLVKGVAERCPAPTLAITDYSHVASVVDVLRLHVQRTRFARQPGINVLIYGPPGTGKTQLVRVLAAEIEFELYEVSSEEAEGSCMDSAERVAALRAAQRFLAQRPALIVFDEAEDLFGNGNKLLEPTRAKRISKGAVNRMLEANPVPTIWLSNSVNGIDSAFIRRFDLVFELPVPPKRERQRMVRNLFSDVIGQDTFDQIAASDHLAPAVLSRAASVLRQIGPDLDRDVSSKAMVLLLNNTLKAQRHPKLRGHDTSQLPELYDLSLVGADTPLEEIADRLNSSRRGRLCLYGPPGTGKTAYGRWLADRLSLPLRIRRASDLLSPYVGETEARIAAAFHDAADAGEILMIDEVDSFLQARQHAQQGWEVTQTNEFLTQLESFGGLFIASTNLMNGMDEAALRRFDLKIKFDFLTPTQAANLLARHCAALGLAGPTVVERRQVECLRNLAPGDFALVQRQHCFRPIASATDFVRSLSKECELKNGESLKLGFF